MIPRHNFHETITNWIRQFSWIGSKAIFSFLIHPLQNYNRHTNVSTTSPPGHTSERHTFHFHRSSKFPRKPCRFGSMSSFLFIPSRRSAFPRIKYSNISLFLGLRRSSFCITFARCPAPIIGICKHHALFGLSKMAPFVATICAVTG